MRHRRLALPVVAGLALAAPQARAVDAFFPAFGNDGYDVQNYALTFDVDAAPPDHGAGRADDPRHRQAQRLRARPVGPRGRRGEGGRDAGPASRRTPASCRSSPPRPSATAPRSRWRSPTTARRAGIDDPTSSTRSPPARLANSKQTSYVVSEPVGASHLVPGQRRADRQGDLPYRGRGRQAVHGGQQRRAADEVTDEGARRRFVWEKRQPMASYLAIARHRPRLPARDSALGERDPGPHLHHAEHAAARGPGVPAGRRR